MIKRTIYEYDIKHSGDEMDRAELLTCLDRLANLCEHNAEVTISVGLHNVVTVRVETVDAL